MSVILGTIFLAVAFAFAAVFPSAAQTPRPPARKPAATGSRPVTPAAANPAPCDCATVAPLRHYVPYVAKQESTHVQTLADGTTITTVTESHVWRDADGRTRTETTRTQPNGDLLRNITISDPVARVRFTWSDGLPTSTKVVTEYPFPQPVRQTTPPNPPAARRYYPFKEESLPPQTIAGVNVEGYRTTRTTPAGYAGNDRDITTVNENWNAPDLGIQMRTVYDDPRNGKTTTEITDLQQTAPDPSLFQPPPGYTVRENNPQ